MAQKAAEVPKKEAATEVEPRNPDGYASDDEQEEEVKQELKAVA